MNPGNRQIQDALLERYLADALDAEAKGRIEATLAASELDRKRLEELRAESAAFLLRHPAGPLVARYEQAARRRAFWKWPALAAPALAAAAVVVVIARAPQEPDFTAKGMSFAVHVKRGESSERLEPSERVHPGDTIRFELRAGGDGFVAVLGRDATGAVTVYYPYGGGQAAPYSAREPLLPAAIELDQSRGLEKLYAVYRRNPFELGPLVEALQQGRRLEGAVPVHTGVVERELNKE